MSVQTDFSSPAMSDLTELGGIVPSVAPQSESWAASVVAEPAEVLANDEVNKEYRHLVVRCGDVSASAAPGQFFQLLCPQTGGEQPFLRRPMSLYGADPERRQVEFLYKVAGAGTRGLAVASRRRPARHHGTAWRRLHARSVAGAISLPSAGGRVLRRWRRWQKRPRQTGRRSPPFSARAGRSFSFRSILFRRQGAEVIAVTDSESTSGPANIERISARPHRRRTVRSILHLRLQPPVARAAAAGAGIRHPGPGRHGAANGLRSRPVLLLRARLQRRRRDRSPPGVLGWAGLRHDGGAAMTRSLCARRRLDPGQPGDAGFGNVRRRARQGDRLRSAGRLRHQDDHARTSRRQSAAACGRAAGRVDQLDRHPLEGRAIFSRAYVAILCVVSTAAWWSASRRRPRKTLRISPRN